MNLSKKLILKNLSDRSVSIEIFEEINSTNSYLKENLENKIKICAAESQTAGRGRMGRSWFAEPGKNINLSISLPLQKKLSEISGMSIALGVAIYRAIHYVTKEENIQLKWPNDLILNNKKFAGVMVELVTNANDNFAIIGIGINVNMANDVEHIDQPWTSLAKELGQEFDRNKLISEITNNVLSGIDEFNHNGLDSFIADWNKHDHFTEKTLTISHNDKTNIGKYRGINNQGLLKLKTSSGINEYAIGDVSILKK